MRSWNVPLPEVANWQSLLTAGYIQPADMLSMVSVFFSLNFFFNVYLFLGEAEHKQGSGRERGGQRIPSGLCSDSLMRGSNS